MLKKFILKLFVLIIIFLNYNLSLSLEKSEDKIKLNASLLASLWLRQNQRDMTSMSDKDLKSTVYQELVKMNAKIGAKTFNEVYKIIRREKIRLALGKQLDKMFKLKTGK
jgi:hypothetical protein